MVSDRKRLRINEIDLDSSTETEDTANDRSDYSRGSADHPPRRSAPRNGRPGGKLRRRRRRTRVLLLVAATTLGAGSAARASQQPDPPSGRPPTAGQPVRPPTGELQGGPGTWTPPPRPEGERPQTGPPRPSPRGPLTGTPEGASHRVEDPGGGEGRCIVTNGKGGVLRGNGGEKLADVPSHIDGIPVYGGCHVAF